MSTPQNQQGQNNAPLRMDQIVRKNLNQMEGEFKSILPEHMSPAKLIRSVMNAIQDNKKLLDCELTSILSAAMSAAVLGLEVDKVTGQGYIVPFKGKAQFMIGYKGYVTLGFNSGYQIDAHIIREKDSFFFKDGIPPVLEFEPGARYEDWKDKPHLIRKADRGAIVGAYCKAVNLVYSGAPPLVEAIHIDDIMSEHRDRSSGWKAYKSGAVKSSTWETDEEAMILKTPIRALASKLPLKVQKAAAMESAYERGAHVSIDKDGEIIETDFEDVTDKPETDSPESPEQSEKQPDNQKGRYDDN